jgi:hypothetical protein
MRRFAITELTVLELWISVQSGASGKRLQSSSRTFSPPRIPVNQSWASATSWLARVELSFFIISARRHPFFNEGGPRSGETGTRILLRVEGNLSGATLRFRALLS